MFYLLAAVMILFTPWPFWLFGGIGYFLGGGWGFMAGAIIGALIYAGIEE